jgi:hypothetical protein
MKASLSVYGLGRSRYLSVRLSEEEWNEYVRVLYEALGFEVMSAQLSRSALFRLLVLRLPKGEDSLSTLEYKRVLFESMRKEGERLGFY